MNIDEARLSVMNAISMAIKEPVLQQCFEIICKENVESKKRNGELAEQKAQIEKMKCCQNCWHRHLFDKECSDCTKFKNWKLREIKENAEIKV